MGNLKCIGLMVLIGLVPFAGLVQAQEPVLNIQAPSTAPILDAEPAAAVETPVVPAPAPVVKPAPVVVSTNHPVHPTAPVITHALTNVPAHVSTNVHVAPVVPVVVAPTNTLIVPITPVVVVPESDEFFVDTWKYPSYQVGTRVLQVKLSDTTRGTPGNGSFFGTITEISDNQDNSPDRIYLQARLFKSPVWLGVSYDHASARTMDDGDGDGIPDLSGGDGDEEIKGFTPYLQAAWDNETRFTPYAQIGYGIYQAEFVPNSWGADGRRRVESMSSVKALELGAGLGIRIYKNLSADIFAKTVQVDDITGDWYYNYGRNYGGPFVMTMSYVAYGAGLSCRF